VKERRATTLMTGPNAQQFLTVRENTQNTQNTQNTENTENTENWKSQSIDLN